MKDLIEHIEEILREKYPLPARAFIESLQWLPTATGLFGICRSDGCLMGLLPLQDQYTYLNGNSLELLERAISKAQTDHVRKEAELRSILSKEIVRLSK